MSAAPGELLESPPARSSGPWIAVAVLAVLALIGWNVFGSASDPSPPAEIATSASYVSNLSFLDETTGFAILNVCSAVDDERDPCPRRLLASADAGVTWETRGRIPILGEGGFNAFVPLSETRAHRGRRG